MRPGSSRPSRPVGSSGSRWSRRNMGRSSATSSSAISRSNRRGAWSRRSPWRRWRLSPSTSGAAWGRRWCGRGCGCVESRAVRSSSSWGIRSITRGSASRRSVPGTSTPRSPARRSWHWNWNRGPARCRGPASLSGAVRNRVDSGHSSAAHRSAVPNQDAPVNIGAAHPKGRLNRQGPRDPYNRNTRPHGYNERSNGRVSG